MLAHVPDRFWRVSEVAGVLAEVAVPEGLGRLREVPEGSRAFWRVKGQAQVLEGFASL